MAAQLGLDVVEDLGDFVGLLGSNLDPPMLVVPVLFLALDAEQFFVYLLELVVVFGNKLAPFHFLEVYLILDETIESGSELWRFPKRLIMNPAHFGLVV